MTNFPTTLIYDGDCAYCRSFAQLIQRFARKRSLTVLICQDEKAQMLLEAQFGSDIGFTMYLFHQDQVRLSRSI